MVRPGKQWAREIGYRRKLKNDGGGWRAGELRTKRQAGRFGLRDNSLNLPGRDQGDIQTDIRQCIAVMAGVQAEDAPLVFQRQPVFQLVGQQHGLPAQQGREEQPSGNPAAGPAVLDMEG